MNEKDRQPSIAKDQARGFGGSVVREPNDILYTSNIADKVFFGIDCEIARVFGTSNHGAAVFIREATARMAPWSDHHSPACHDIGVLRSKPEKAISEIIEISALLAASNRIPILIGCDHTASYAHALGTSVAEPSAYIYFDAHFDLGVHVPSTTLHNGNFVAALLHSGRYETALNIGGRSWTTHEPSYEDISRFSTISALDSHNSIDDITANLKPFFGKNVYVSIDADILDPAFAPNVCCPEPFGMSPKDLLALCSWIGLHCTVVGADLCELVPAATSTQAEQVLLRCIHALFPIKTPTDDNNA
ncbi:MAG: arginase family protein [Candidatus Thiodiazotropha endolucinida]